MAVPLIAASVIGGAAISVLFTAVADFMQDRSPDQAVIKQVQDAQDARASELQGEGMDKSAAISRAKLETASAMKQAMMERPDAITASDYMSSLLTGAALGLVPFGIGAAAKGAAGMRQVGKWLAETGGGKGASGKIGSFLAQKGNTLGKSELDTLSKRAGAVKAGPTMQERKGVKDFLAKGNAPMAKPMPAQASTPMAPSRTGVVDIPEDYGMASMNRGPGKQINQGMRPEPSRLAYADDATMNPAPAGVYRGGMRPEPLRIEGRQKTIDTTGEVVPQPQQVADDFADRLASMMPAPMRTSDTYSSARSQLLANTEKQAQMASMRQGRGAREAFAKRATTDRAYEQASASEAMQMLAAHKRSPEAQAEMEAFLSKLAESRNRKWQYAPGD